MTDWIDLNLPYYVYNYDFAEYIVAKDKLNKELKEEYKKKFNIDVDKIEKGNIDLIDKYSKVINEMYDKYGFATDEFDAALNEYKKTEEYKKYREIEKIFAHELKWIHEHEKMDKFENEVDEKCEVDNFCSRGLNKPGTLIEVKHKDGEIKQYLLGSCCNKYKCEMPYQDGFSIILRYKVIWEEE